MLLTLPAHCGLGVVDELLEGVSDADDLSLTVVIPPDVVHVHPVVLCLLASVAARVREAGGFVLVSGEPEEGGYLDQMELLPTLLQTEPGGRKRPDPTGRYIALFQISDNETLNEFISDFVPLLHAPAQTALAFSYVLSELIRNVLEHSGSRVGAFVAADLDEDGTVRLGVVDAGIGVPATIRRSHSAATERDAVGLAFRPGISGTSASFGGSERNGGAGLFVMKSIALLSRRILMMFTQKTLMRLEPQAADGGLQITETLEDDEVTWREFEWSFAGTAVGIDLDISSGRQYEELFADIRRAYNSTVKTRAKTQKRARFT